MGEPQKKKNMRAQKALISYCSSLQRSLFMSSYASTLSRTQGISLLCHELLFERRICMYERSKEEVGQDVIKWPLSTWRCVALEASLSLHLPTFRDTFCVSRWSSFSSSSSSSVWDSARSPRLLLDKNNDDAINHPNQNSTESTSLDLLASWPFYPFFSPMFFKEVLSYEYTPKSRILQHYEAFEKCSIACLVHNSLFVTFYHSSNWNSIEVTNGGLIVGKIVTLQSLEKKGQFDDFQSYWIPKKSSQIGRDWQFRLCKDTCVNTPEVDKSGPFPRWDEKE